MPSTAEIAARIERDGEDVVLRRPGAPPVELPIRAFVRDYQPSELVNGVLQGDRHVRFPDTRLAAAGWPGPPRKGDQLLIEGRTTTVQTCVPRRHRGEIAMHVAWVRGA